ncbi:MAG: family 43 glycosylhydrolase [Cyclobacteriaceae bacterium]
MFSNLITIVQFLVVVVTMLGWVSGYAQSDQIEQNEFYTNPIMPGNWSDPGIIKVGDDYYSMCSSNEWQPGVPIVHSKDLVNWEYIGHAFLENPLLNAGETFRGVWGGEMAYNPNTCQFLIYVPIMGHMYVYYANKPEGPYSHPVKLDLGGVDPGFFADEDGSLYIISGEGKIMSLTEDGLKTREVVAEIDISGYKPFEGPDIFKRGKYYYLVFSPGGTRPHQPSTISTMRATDLKGPWMKDPQNPNMFCTDNPSSKFEGPAHATLIEVKDGQWYLFYHAHELSHYSLGRPMLMEPVQWSTNGWWKPVNGKIPSRKNRRPELPASAFKLADSDEFNSENLGLQWFFNCTPDYSGVAWSLSERPGFMRVKTKAGDISSHNSLTNVFLQRVISKNFEFTTLLDFDAKDNNEKAGLHMYHDAGMNFWLASTMVRGEKVLEVGKYNNGKKKVLWTAPNNIGNQVYLKIEVDGEETARFYYSADNSTWTNLGGTIYFGDSGMDLRNNRKGNPDLGWSGINKRNAWSAATFGFFAVADGAQKSNHADFDFFRVTIKDQSANEF